MLNKKIEEMIEDTCEKICEDECGEDEGCMEECMEKCSNTIEDQFDDHEITFFSEKAEVVEDLVNKLWKINEEIRKEGLRKCDPAIGIEYYFKRAYNALYNLKESIEDYTYYLVELKKKGEL